MEARSERPKRNCRIAYQLRESHPVSETESEKNSNNSSIISVDSETEVTINHLGNLIPPASENFTLTPARIMLTPEKLSETPLSSSAHPKDDVEIDNIDKGGELMGMLEDLAHNASAVTMASPDLKVPLPTQQNPNHTLSPKDSPSEHMWPFSPACNPTTDPTLEGAHIMQSVHSILNEFIAKLENERKNDQLLLQQQFENWRREYHQEQLEFQRHFYEQLLKMQQANSTLQQQNLPSTQQISPLMQQQQQLQQQQQQLQNQNQPEPTQPSEPLTIITEGISNPYNAGKNQKKKKIDKKEQSKQQRKQLIEQATVIQKQYELVTQKEKNEEQDIMPTKPKPQKSSVMMLGSSIIKHVKGGMINKRTGKRVKVCCYPGAGIEKVIDHAEVELKYQLPEVAIIHAGGNDVANGITLEHIIADTSYLGQELLARGVSRIAISGMTPRVDMKDSIPKLNQLFKKMCATNKFDFIDNSNIRYSFKDPEGYYKSHLSYDKIHLNYEGVEILESNYIRYLKGLKLGTEE